MNINEILDQWDSDSNMSPSDMTGESIKSPKLHAKYYRLLVEERLRLEQMKQDKKVLYHDLFDYFVGDISEELLKKRQWKPRLRSRILKTDFQMHLESDETWTQNNLKVALQTEKVEALDAIIKVINNRSFHINNIISWEKFRNGGS